MRELLPHGYRDISYLVLEPGSPLTFAALPGRPTLQAAISHAVVVKRYGTIDIYRVETSARRAPGKRTAQPPRRRVKPGGMTRSSGESSAIEERPSPSRQASMPDRIRSRTFSTPAWPLAARPHR